MPKGHCVYAGPRSLSASDSKIGPFAEIRQSVFEYEVEVDIVAFQL